MGAMNGGIFVLDDDDDLRVVLVDLIRRSTSRECIGLRTLDELRQQRAAVMQCALGVLDVNLGSGQPSGLDAFAWLRAERFAGRIAFLTGHGANTPAGSPRRRDGPGGGAAQAPADLAPRRALAVSVAGRSDAAAAFEARSAWWSALAINVFVLVSATDRLISETERGRAEALLGMATVALSGALVAALIATSRAPRMRLALAAWILAILPYMAMLPILGHRWDLGHRAWEPLFRQKFALLLVAAFAPPRFGFGIMPIVVLLGETALEYWGLGLRNSPYDLGGEPGRTLLFYGGLAVAVAYWRARDLQRERALVEREQEALVVERLARVALAVHDVTNNALQTLVASAAIVEKDPTESARLAAGMVRAVDKLKAVNDAFGAYQRQIDWHPGDESFDAGAVMASAGANDRGSPDAAA